jgi:hypothetical protein
MRDIKRIIEHEGRPVMKREPLNTRDKAKIKTQAAEGLSVYRIAKQVKRAPNTIKKFLQDPAIATEVAHNKIKVAERCEFEALRIINSIDDQNLEKASLQNKAVSAGILIDKGLLLRGQMPLTVHVEVLLAAVADIRQMRKLASPQPQLPSVAEPIDVSPVQPARAEIEPQPALRVGKTLQGGECCQDAKAPDADPPKTNCF